MLGRTVTMFDSVNVSEIPTSAKYAAGYIGGQWPTYANGSLERHLPNARLVSIAVAAQYDAECLDVEQGDATNADAPAWVRRQWARGVKRPKLYTSVSNWKALQATLSAAGIKRRPWPFKSYRRWSAHYTYSAHRCGRSCGMPGFLRAGATQWTDKALGRNLDASQCVLSFFR